MDPNDTSIVCAITIDWVNSQGVSVRKIVHKFAALRLIRNDLREMFVEVSTEKTTPVKLCLRGIVVHKKFMAEGKASIKFNQENCTIYLSNAPPGPLMIFLKTLFIKMTGDRPTEQNGANKNIKAHLLLEKSNKFDEISPITNLELLRAKKMIGLSKGSTTTPSPPQSKKRKLEGVDNKGVPAAKKLYIADKPSNSSQTDDALPLNSEQSEIYQSCLNGKNIFFTGSAGTGKSFLLRKIISALPPDGTVATASTGVAACLIGGVTLHSFAGIGDGEASLKRCYELASRPVICQIWRKCKRLIIDEISMVDGQYFEKIEAVARHIRRNDKPFGGIQLILCGDFLQLPPVTKTFDNKGVQPKRFCFQSEAWQKVISVSYELKIVHRQKDSEFVKILNLLRIGHVNEEITTKLLATSSQKIESNGILATQLCSHTQDANIINESKLERLDTESKVFDAQDSGAIKQLDAQVPAPGKLELKIGAQVMLLKNINISDGLVNGARGIVVKFGEHGTPVVKFKNNKEYVAKPEKWIIKTPAGAVLTRKQIPLKLAWAFSIHKSQGLTLDCVEMSLSKVFEAGQAYVALSRAQSLKSVRVLDFDAKQVWANTDVLHFYKMFRRQLMDTTFIPLGQNHIKRGLLGDKQGAKKTVSKISKSLLNKPLVNIC